MLPSLRIFSLALLLSIATRATLASDPLPSWNDGPVKRAILAFAEQAADPASPKHIPVADRIAVFDNDGTLWPENPIPFQLAFVIDELKRRLPENPAWKENPLVTAAVEGRMESILAGGTQALIELLDLTHADVATEEFDRRVRDWLKSANHPRFDRRYDTLGYAPMRELLDYLRSRGFKTYIVSGGGQDFMRVWAESVYGIPPEWVIGSYARTEYALIDGKPTLTKRPGVEFIDDKAGKPVAIDRFIGRRPVAAFGNSDGDKAMLEWTTVGRPNTLGVIVHHTDDTREYAYDSAPKSTGKLIEALKDAPARGWHVIDIKQDWNRVFRSGP
ncbi:haloacid dehalogenase-like hydrolase [bacterium]|nr:haloacid dehalogenase-like hydrolase [bacterium]